MTEESPFEEYGQIVEAISANVSRCPPDVTVTIQQLCNDAINAPVTDALFYFRSFGSGAVSVPKEMLNLYVLNSRHAFDLKKFLGRVNGHERSGYLKN